jgi:hypothetical protein
MRFFHVFDLIKCHFGVTLSERNIAIPGELYIRGVLRRVSGGVLLSEKQTKTTIKNRVIRCCDGFASDGGECENSA